MKTFFLNVAFIFLCTQIYGQYLVTNGGFEEQEEGFARGWIATAGSPDYINLETSSKVKTMGVRDFPIPGENNNGYMGILIGGASSEVFHQELNDKLEKDATYELSCMVLAGNYCRTGFETVTIAVSPMQLESSEYSKDYKVKCHNLSTQENVIPHGEWIQLQTAFKAMGHEKYISIGNFNSENSQFRMSAREMMEHGSGTSCNYIYFDKIELKKVSKPEIENKIVLNDVLFDSGKSTLKHGLENLLDSIYIQLQSHNKAILIVGHTDNVGSVEMNQKLSENRAESLRQYFVRRGYNPELIISKGLNEKEPIASNDTESGRQKNRRVEIIFQE